MDDQVQTINPCPHILNIERCTRPIMKLRWLDWGVYCKIGPEVCEYRGIPIAGYERCPRFQDFAEALAIVDVRDTEQELGGRMDLRYEVALATATNKLGERTGREYRK